MYFGSNTIFLFFTFFIKNEYKIITGKVINYINHYFWIHIILIIIVTFYFSDSKLLNLKAVHTNFHMSFSSVILFGLMLLPMITKIGRAHV